MHGASENIAPEPPAMKCYALMTNTPSLFTRILEDKYAYFRMVLKGNTTVVLEELV